MTQKVMEAYPNAAVLLLNTNADMEVYAKENGVPPERIHVSDITDMRIGSDGKGGGSKIPDASVEHVYSHSVLWMLENPEQFVAESARVLKKGGRLSISSFKPSMADPQQREAFVRSLENDMQNAFEEGRISESVRDTMINANKTITERKTHTYLDPSQVVAMAERHGLRLISAKDVYEGTFFFMAFEKI